MSTGSQNLDRLLEMVKAAYRENALIIEGPRAPGDTASFSLALRPDLTDLQSQRLQAICHDTPA